MERGEQPLGDAVGLFHGEAVAPVEDAGEVGLARRC